MAKKTGPSIFLPTDKNIFDALQHKKIKQQDLVDLLRRRNIVVSPFLDKYELSLLVSRLLIDYEDFLSITRLLENPNRKEKTTRSTIKAEITDEEVKKACQLVKESGSGDDQFRIVKNDSDTTSLIVTYTDFDFTKTELRQRTIKKCEIEIQREGEELTFRMPSNDKAKGVVSRIKSQLSDLKGEVLKDEVISLENIIQPEARSYFFDQLIRSVPSYKFDDVSSVDVYHTVDTLDDDDDDAQSGRIASYIKKAALAGNSVLESTEFNQLHNRGFFISKIVWTAEKDSVGGDKVEFEAEFGDPSSCTDFKYLVRGVYNYNDRTNDHNVTRRPASPLEVKRLNELLEKSAKSSFEAVESRY